MRVAAAAVLFLAACSGASGSDNGRGAVRDSAGIAIVESDAPAWARGGGWEIAPAARFTAGLPGTDSTPPSGRIWGAVFLGDGRIAIADALARRVHVLDGRGRYLASMGGRGDGAGRLASLVRLLAYRGDSIAVYDLSRATIDVFTADGAYGRTIQVERGRGRHAPFAVLERGRFALWNGIGNGARNDRGRAAEIAIAILDGTRVEPVAVLSETGGAAAFVAGGADEIVWARSDRREIARLDAAGTPRALLRWGAPADSTTAPPSSLRWTTGGQVWARRRTDAAAAETWDVFDRDGHWLGPMVLPPGATLLDVGDDGVLVRTLAGDGTDRVALHEIRPASGLGGG